MEQLQTARIKFMFKNTRKATRRNLLVILMGIGLFGHLSAPNQALKANGE